MADQEHVTEQFRTILANRCRDEQARGANCFIHEILSTVEAPAGYFLTGFVDHDLPEQVDIGIEWHRDETRNLDLFVHLIGNELVNRPNLSWDEVVTLANRINGEHKVHVAYEEWREDLHRDLYKSNLLLAITNRLTVGADHQSLTAVRSLISFEEQFHYHSPVTPERVLTAWNAIHGHSNR